MTFRADVEGLRAVAVAIVVLAHARLGFAAGGYVGVDVFFVISGFLITSCWSASSTAAAGCRWRASTRAGSSA
jgi:peptidoglycan/LPS O-acetylase OafA/YrhL